MPIELKRKWGGEGILGCELSQGHLYRFPGDVEKYREGVVEQERKRQENLAVRRELANSDGTGKMLAEALKRKAYNQPKKKTIIKNP